MAKPIKYKSKHTHKHDKKHKHKKKTLKAYTIWVAVIYKQKETNNVDKVAHAQNAMTIKSYKKQKEFTPEFVSNSARDWMEKNWLSDIEYIGLDYENHQPPYNITLLKDVALKDLPLYSFKEDVTKGMRFYNKFLPLFDGLVKEPDDDLTKEFENKCGEFGIYYTLANAVKRGYIEKRYIDPDFIEQFFKGKFTLNKIKEYFEIINRVNVRIFDQVGTLLIKVDAHDPLGDIHAIDDGSGNLAFKRAYASLCAVIADTSGIPHMHIISDPSVKKPIIQTDKLNIFPSSWYYGTNFEYVENPIDHESTAKLILFDATVPGHAMTQVIEAIMARTGYVITNIRFDSTGIPDSFIEPTTAQQYTAVSNYYQRKAIADNLYNEMKFNEFEWNGQNEGELCYQYLRLKHNKNLKELKSFFNIEMHQLIYERANRGQFISRCSADTYDFSNDSSHENIELTGYDENSQFGDILVTMETDWIALDYWSELVEFNAYKHITKNKLTNGLYLLNRCPTSNDKLLMYYPETLYTSHMIKFLLHTNAITLDDIEFVVVAPKIFKHDYFKIPFIELRKRFYENPSWYKAMQNQFVGRLYKMFTKVHNVAVLFNPDFAQGLRAEWEKDINCTVTLNSVNSVNNVWWLKKTIRDVKTCSAALIRVQILEEAKIRNFWRAHALTLGASNCKILCHMCDCTIAKDANRQENEKALNNMFLEKKDRMPGSLKIEYKKRLTGKTAEEYNGICNSIEPYIQTRDIVNIIKITPSGDKLAEHVNLVLETSNSLITATHGGGGKSFLMAAVAVELRNQNKNAVFLLPMHKHKDTVIAKGRMFGVEFEHKTDIFLYADFVNKKHIEIIKMFRKRNIHTVILEEIAQTNTDYIRQVAMLQRICKFNVLASGDCMQCDPPLEKNQVYTNLFSNKYFRQLTGNNEINIQYNPQFGRYPIDLSNLISQFHQTYIFPTFPVAQELTMMHLTCTNGKARELCSLCSDKFSENKTRIKQHEFYYCEGMLLVGVQNNGNLKGGIYDTNTKYHPKQYKVHNREVYEILSLDDVNNTFNLFNIKLKTIFENVELNSVYNMMMPFFAMTIDASQSSQIDIPFTIHELDHPRFSIELANVAISRSTKLEYILKASEYQPEYQLLHTKRKNQVKLLALSDYTNNNYAHTKIYEIWIKDELKYIGHTYLTVEERLNQHLQESKKNPRTRFHQYLATVNHSTDVIIKQVKQYKLENKAQAEAAEMKYLDQKLKEGHNLLNVQIETTDVIKQREIQASTNDMRIQASFLKEIAKRIKREELIFSIYDYPDDKFFNVTFKLLQNKPVNKKFKYTLKGKEDVKITILTHINEIRTMYKLPPAIMSWDSVPVEILKTKIEKHMEDNNITAQTFIGFYLTDDTKESRIKLGYSINNNPRKYKYFKYSACGIEEVKNKISEFMNSLRTTYGLQEQQYKWNGLEFDII